MQPGADYSREREPAPCQGASWVGEKWANTKGHRLEGWEAVRRINGLLILEAGGYPHFFESPLSQAWLSLPLLPHFPATSSDPLLPQRMLSL